MSMNTSVILSDHFTSFINEQVKEGRYQSTSEVIRAGLRALEQQEKEHEIKLATLHAALEEGRNSGIAADFDFDEFLARKRAEHTQ